MDNEKMKTCKKCNGLMTTDDYHCNPLCEFCLDAKKGFFD